MKFSSMVVIVIAAALFSSTCCSASIPGTSSSSWNESFDDRTVRVEDEGPQFMMDSEINRRQLAAAHPLTPRTLDPSKSVIAKCDRGKYTPCVPRSDGKPRVRCSTYDRCRP
ncbi:Rapid ALkalinization Factor [Dillenia turbinata]|uniref:Rapid ALkalinization Factor n=1 Tax=Dillenia turbinata TaxID=194707 RepID=A0AAN8UMQ4_9MAGN